MAEAGRVREDVDFGDLPVPDREAHDGERLPVAGYDDSGGSVYQRWPCERDKAGEAECLSGHGVRAADLPGCPGGHGAVVGPDHDVGVEQGDQCVEVAVPGGGEASWL